LIVILANENCIQVQRSVSESTWSENGGVYQPSQGDSLARQTGNNLLGASKLAGNFDPNSKICINKRKGRAVQLTAAMLLQEDLAVYEEASEQIWNESDCF